MVISKKVWTGQLDLDAGGHFIVHGWGKTCNQEINLGFFFPDTITLTEKLTK